MQRPGKTKEEQGSPSPKDRIPEWEGTGARTHSRWGSCLQPRQLGSGLRDDLGRWGREGREAQGGGGVCAHRGKHHTLLCDAKEHGTVERLYSFFFLKGYTPFCGLSRKSIPLPFLASMCRPPDPWLRACIIHRFLCFSSFLCPLSPTFFFLFSHV